MAGPVTKPAQPTVTTTPNDDADMEKRLKQLRELDDQQRRRRPGGSDWVPYRYIERSQGSKYVGYNDAAYDSRLILYGGANAELTLILRVFFQRFDPTDKGGNQNVVRKQGHAFRLEGITDEELSAFRWKACYQANETWKGVGLVTPNDFAGFDWPKGNPTVRPNVNCSLRFEVAPCPAAAHATVRVVKSSERGFRSFVNLKLGDSTWDIKDTLWTQGYAFQDRGFVREPIWQHMVPHEVGHLLGLEHIGKTMQVRSCTYTSNPCSPLEEEAKEYGKSESLPMWFARDIMGIGRVVHACDLYPWSVAMGQHTRIDAAKWIHAGTQIPPRAIQAIPKANRIPPNSPYTGGLQETGQY